MASIQITVRSIPDSPSIEYHIQKNFLKIDRIYKKVSNVRVVVDVAQKHKHKGKLFSVSVAAMTPGRELFSRKQNLNLFVAIRSAFSTIEKLLRKYEKRKPATIDKNTIHILRDATQIPVHQ